MSNEHKAVPTRESKLWWAVTEDGVQEVVGYSCKPNNPDIWWCPSVGYSMTEGHHLFANPNDALKKAIKETEQEIDNARAKLDRLKKGLAEK